MYAYYLNLCIKIKLFRLSIDNESGWATIMTFVLLNVGMMGPGRISLSVLGCVPFTLYLQNLYEILIYVLLFIFNWRYIWRIFHIMTFMIVTNGIWIISPVMDLYVHVILLEVETYQC